MSELSLVHSNGARRRSLIHRLTNVVTSLQFKATLLVVVITLCVTAAVTGYLLQSSVNLIRRQNQELLVQATSILAEAVAAPCAEKNADLLAEIVSNAANGMPLLYAVVTDVDGRELAAAEYGASDVLQYARTMRISDLPLLGRPLPHRTPDGKHIYLDVAYPIGLRSESGGDDVQLVGYMRAGTQANRWHQTMSNKLDMVVGVGVLATAVAIVLGFLLIRRIVSPLGSLASAMLQFSRGDLTVRSPVRRRDEIGQLAAAFNRMADQHQQTHGRILRLNAELEDRVAQRTQQLRDLAARDPLTGIYNRRHFSEVLERSFSESHRYDNDLTCVMMDVDDFKAVNDKHGHQVGDRLLVLLASTITRQLRSADVAARYGGDEFIALLPQTDVQSAEALVGRIVSRFDEDMKQMLPDVRVTLSVGIAGLQSCRAEDADGLVRNADHAMYEAKRAGKNCIIISSDAVKPATP